MLQQRSHVGFVQIAAKRHNIGCASGSNRFRHPFNELEIQLAVVVAKGDLNEFAAGGRKSGIIDPLGHGEPESSTVGQRMGSRHIAPEHSRVAQLQVMQLFMTLETEKSGVTRRQWAAGAAAASLTGLPLPAQAALGTARVIGVSPTGGPRLGLKSYPGTLPLADGEVVLTFDDGPLPATTGPVLDTLAREGVRATFFLIGRNARANPQYVRRIAAAGHTLANHTMTHPWTLRQRSFATGLQDILDGQDAIVQAAGQRIAPFFRFPGFADTPELLAELSRRNIAVWGTDLWASDWNEMTPGAQLQLLYSRVVKARKGIVLLHDTRPQTAAMLPSFLSALKQGGFKVVHAVEG